jgi:hypothetical protein
MYVRTFRRRFRTFACSGTGRWAVSGQLLGSRLRRLVPEIWRVMGKSPYLSMQPPSQTFARYQRRGRDTSGPVASVGQALQAAH